MSGGWELEKDFCLYGLQIETWRPCRQHGRLELRQLIGIEGKISVSS
jgi:hypothetical protein